MTETLETVTKKKPEPTAEQAAAEELVRQAREQGLSLTGPDGLLKQLTKVVIETALDQDLTEHLGHEKNTPAGKEAGNVRNGSRPKTVLTEGTGQVGIEVPGGWLGVGPGLALSLFANVESGIRYGWLAVVWAGIPAVSFFLACFILENWLKGQGNSTAHPAGAPEANHAAVPGDASEASLAGPVSAPADVPVQAVTSAPAGVVKSAPKPRSVKPATKGAVKAKSPAEVYAAELAAGEVPSLRQLKADLHVGQDKAKAIQAELSEQLRTAAAA